MISILTTITAIIKQLYQPTNPLLPVYTDTKCSCMIVRFMSIGKLVHSEVMFETAKTHTWMVTAFVWM